MIYLYSFLIGSCAFGITVLIIWGMHKMMEKAMGVDDE